MSIVQAVALGVTQGVTEFLPISSDGHLWIVYRLFGDAPDLTFEIFLHFATLLVLIVYFRGDLAALLASLLPKNRDQRAERRLVALIAVGTLVTGAVALLLRDSVDAANSSGLWVALGFWFTSLVMIAAELLGPRTAQVGQAEALPLWRVVPIGLLQALAILPGVSRSGSTISGGMLSGLDREHAARFSFLLGIPIIALATASDAVDLATGATRLPPLAPSVAGFIAAAAAGYLAIWGLLAFVKHHRLYWFAAYTALLGTAILVLEVL